jgi:hypothetical protein
MDGIKVDIRVVWPRWVGCDPECHGKKGETRDSGYDYHFDRRFAKGEFD